MLLRGSRYSNVIFIGLFAVMASITWLCGVLSLYTGWELLPPLQEAQVIGSQLMLSTCSTPAEEVIPVVAPLCFKSRIVFQFNQTHDMCASIDHRYMEALTPTLQNTTQLDMYRQEHYPLHSTHLVYYSPFSWSEEIPLCYSVSTDVKEKQHMIRKRTEDYQMIAYGGTITLMILYKHLRILCQQPK